MIDLLLATTLALSPTKGGPDPGPAPTPTIEHVTVFEDDPARGALDCQVELATLAPGSTCRVQPTATAPDLALPGWITQIGPPWLLPTPTAPPPPVPDNSSDKDGDSGSDGPPSGSSPGLRPDMWSWLWRWLTG